MLFSFQGQETKLLSSCCGIFECSISLLRPCPTFASLGHPRSDFLLPRRPCPHTHPRVAAPFLRITSAHVFRRLLLHAAATACERCVRHMALTRVVYPALSKLYDGRHELYREACMRQNPERPRQEEKHTHQQDKSLGLLRAYGKLW